MSNNKSFWRAWLEGIREKDSLTAEPGAEVNKTDPLEEGLKELSWLDSGKAAVSRFRKKTQSFAEEVGNTVTHGVMAIFMLAILPYAAIRSYVRAPAGKGTLDSFGVSVFVISVFLMFLASTIYHSMAHSTLHKSVMNRLDHIMVYVAIAGTYTPICLSVIGGAWGIGLCIAQWALVLAGALFKSLAFSKTIRSYILSVSIYLLMGWMVVLCLPIFWEAASRPTFWLVLAGGFSYTAGVICFAMKFKFSHMVWHFLVDFGAICHLLAIVFFMR